MIEKPGDLYERDYYSAEPHRMASAESDVARYMAGVMAWMFAGLLTTAFVTYVIVSSSTLINLLFSSSVLYFGVIIVQLALVLGLSAALRRLSPAAAAVLFMAYSALTGITLSVFLILFETFSVLFIFGITSFVFLALAVFGFTTRRDLTSVGRLAIFGLFGIILAGLVNWFFQNAMMDFLITCAGVVIFLALIAYDTQKVKAIYLEASARGIGGDHPELRKLTIYGAFTLYLDFINLFIRLLSLFGKRRR